MSTRHLRQQLRRLKRRAGFGERQYEAAAKRHEARLEKRDLQFPIDIYEICWPIDQEEDNDRSKQVPDLSEHESYQKNLSRREKLCELLGKDTPERCAEDQDTIEEYQLLHFGYLRPDYHGGWGRTIEEMVKNRHENRWETKRRRGLSQAEKDKEDEEFLRELFQEIDAALMVSAESPNASETKVGEESHAPNDEPSCPDGGSSSSSDGNPSLPSDINSTVTPDDEESAPPGDEDVRPRLIGEVRNGVFVEYPKK